MLGYGIESVKGKQQEKQQFLKVWAPFSIAQIGIILKKKSNLAGFRRGRTLSFFPEASKKDGPAKSCRNEGFDRSKRAKT